MLEIADTDLKTYPFDHHGLIAAVCEDLRIAERIDQLLPPLNPWVYLTHEFSVIEDYSIHRLDELTPSRVKAALQVHT